MKKLIKTKNNMKIKDKYWYVVKILDLKVLPMRICEMIRNVIGNMYLYIY